MAVRRRASLSYPRQWSPRIVPTWPVEVNWGHPLSVGLVFLSVPGSTRGLVDLSGTVPPLVANSTTTITNSPLGSSISSLGANQGASYVGIPSALKLAYAGSLFWAGSVISAVAGYGAPLIGVNYSNTDSSPYFSYSLVAVNNSINFWCSSTNVTVVSSPNATITNMSLSFQAGGSFSFFMNGSNASSGAVGSAALGYSANSAVAVGYYNGVPSRYSGVNTAIAGIYNYVLPGNLLAWLNAEPFAMLRPIIRRSYYYAGMLLRSRPLIVVGA